MISGVGMYKCHGEVRVSDTRWITRLKKSQNIKVTMEAYHEEI